MVDLPGLERLLDHGLDVFEGTTANRQKLILFPHKEFAAPILPIMLVAWVVNVVKVMAHTYHRRHSGPPRNPVQSRRGLLSMGAERARAQRLKPGELPEKDQGGPAAAGTPSAHKVSRDRRLGSLEATPEAVMRRLLRLGRCGDRQRFPEQSV